MCLLTLLIQAKNSSANWGATGGKNFIKAIFDIKIKISTFEITNVLSFNKFSDRAGDKYLIKIKFDIKIEIDIFEISIQPIFNKF